MNDVRSIFPSSVGKDTVSVYARFSRTLSRHPPLKKLITLIGPLEYEIPIWPSMNDAVLYAVIGQMLSVSASSSIIGRLRRDLGSSTAILQWACKNCYKRGPVKGVSQRKRKALKAWFIYAANGHAKRSKWINMPLNEYRDEICSIWGFGKWSADMIAIFHLGRMDIWPETDAGIQRASRLVFGTDKFTAINKLIAGCETVTALYLWEMLNRNLVHHFTGSCDG